MIETSTSERTRNQLLQAGLEEFAAKGYAGARTRGIAARAGVNQQLIAYHFGGKQGLLEELRARWAMTEAAVGSADASFDESLAGYLDATLEQPEWARLVLWQALGDHPGHDRKQRDAQRAKLQASVKRIRRRQRDGELTGEVQPEFVLLLAYALAFAPIALPGIVESVLETEPCSPEYRHRVAEQLHSLLDPDRGRARSEGLDE